MVCPCPAELEIRWVLPPPFLFSRETRNSKERKKLEKNSEERIKLEKRDRPRTDNTTIYHHFCHSPFSTLVEIALFPHLKQRHAIRYRRLWRRGGMTRIMLNAATSLEFLIFSGVHPFFLRKNAHGPFLKRVST